MSIPPGTRLGPYEIVTLVGVGGMGQVYRARDLRLHRDVAIKVLPAQWLADDEKRSRFVHEARAAAALNHPNIVTIHEIDSANGVDFIVMEYVRGQSLDTRGLANGARLPDILRVATAIADALAAAHSRGIIHRDLKPANMMVSNEGVVKILDFGLAKISSDAALNPPDAGQTTLVAPLTRVGTIAGTAAYMSPEQATGGMVDARSDIFSFGAVLYEMVTGARAFPGGTPADTMLSVVRDQPKAPRALVSGVPDTLERIISRCLQKDPRQRFQHIDDVRVELEEIRNDAIPSLAGSASPVPFARRWKAALAAPAVLIAVAAAAVLLSHTRAPALPAPTVMQVSSERWTKEGTFSPDGTMVAYASAGDIGTNWDIWVRIIGQAETRQLTTDPAAEGYPSWSRDGNQIAFLRYQTGTIPGGLDSVGLIYTVTAAGGADRRVSDFPARRQLSWSPDSQWLAAAEASVDGSPGGAIHLVSLASGETTALTQVQPGAADLSPAFSPDGKWLAYLSCFGPIELPDCEVYVLPLNSQLRPTGPAQRVLSQLVRGSGLAWTHDGQSLIYDGLFRIRIGADAAPERLEIAAGGDSPVVSRTGDRLLFVRPGGGSPDIYILRPDGSSAPLIQSAYAELQPQFSAAADRIAFGSSRGGPGEIWLSNADGSNAFPLTHGPGLAQGYPNWSRDGKHIVFDSEDTNGHRDVWMIDVAGNNLRRVTHGPPDNTIPSWSRDGSIYFTSSRTGRDEIWRVAPDGTGEQPMTTNGGTFPFESADGTTLYYRAPDQRLVGRPIKGGPERTILPCVRIFGYAVAEHGLYYHQCTGQNVGAAPLRTIQYWDATTGRDSPVGQVEADWVGGMTAGKNGTVIYGRGMSTADLMMIDHFR